MQPIISSVFNPDSRTILLVAYALPRDDATRLLLKHNAELCADIARSLRTLRQVDCSVLLCAYLSSGYTVHACQNAVDLFWHKTARTMDVFTAVCYADLTPEPTLVLALRCLNRLLATRISLDAFAAVRNAENALIEQETRQ